MRNSMNMSEVVSTRDYNPVLVRPKVREGLAPAQMGSVMMAFGELFRDNSFQAAPRTNPPKATGIMDTITKLKSLIVERRVLTPDDYQQVPRLLRRLRHLFRVYYDARLSGRKGPDFVYCDTSKMNDVGLDLHEVGLTLQLAPGRLPALFQHAPEMDAFLLSEPIDLGKWRTEAFHRTEAVKADPESTSDEALAAEELADKAGSDLAAYLIIFFVADVLVAWILISPRDDTERQRCQKSLQLLVAYTSQPIYRKLDVFGDALTDALRPVYTTPSVLTKFAQAGGLPGLFEDWATSTAKDGYCKTAVESLTPAAFEHQTEESLFGIMRGLNSKLERDGDSAVTDPIFVRTVYQIHRLYGHEIFGKGVKLSKWSILFYFLHRRISKKPDAFRSQQAIRNLLKRYRNVPRATRTRHGWALLSNSDRWECLGFYGCGNTGCPEGKALKALKERRKRRERDPAVEERLERWGSQTVEVCRIALWHVRERTGPCIRPKVECQKKTKQDRDQMEVDI